MFLREGPKAELNERQTSDTIRMVVDLILNYSIQDIVDLFRFGFIPAEFP